MTPNWTLRLPGKPYDGDDPDGFLTREEIVTFLEGNAAEFDPPVRFAVGTFQRPAIPSISRNVPDGIHQLHTAAYRNSDQLPDGNVLVVGSGQSGTQIGRELAEHRREIHVSWDGEGAFPEPLAAGMACPGHSTSG